MLELKKINFSYSPRRRTLKEINYAFRPGALTGILGPNGSGKTTLIKIIASILKQNSGEVLLGGKSSAFMKLEETARLISYVPQKIIFFPDLTVMEAIVTGRRPYMRWEPSREDRKEVSEMIFRLELENIKMKNINAISGGEFQKVLIAQALVKKPEIMLFDEPLNNLDIKNQIKIMSVIKEITGAMGLTSVVVIHDINMALKYCDELVFMKNGEILSSGPPGTVNEKVIADIFGVDGKIEFFNGRPAVLY